MVSARDVRDPGCEQRLTSAKHGFGHRQALMTSTPRHYGMKLKKELRGACTGRCGRCWTNQIAAKQKAEQFNSSAS
jgi:hypothetical protein